MDLIKYNKQELINNNNNLLSKFDKYVLSIYIPILFYRIPNKNPILDEIFYILTLYIHIKGYMSFVNVLTKLYSINNKKMYSINDEKYNSIDDENFININYLIQTKNIAKLNSLTIDSKTLFISEYNYYRLITNDNLFTKDELINEKDTIFFIYNDIHKICRSDKFTCRSNALKYHPDKVKNNNTNAFNIYNKLYNMFVKLYFS